MRHRTHRRQHARRAGKKRNLSRKALAKKRKLRKGGSEMEQSPIQYRCVKCGQWFPNKMDGSGCKHQPIPVEPIEQSPPRKLLYRNLARIEVSPSLIAMITSGTYRVTANSVPADATIVSSGYDLSSNVFVVVLEHESFPPVKVGDRILTFDSPMIERVLDS